MNQAENIPSVRRRFVRRSTVAWLGAGTAALAFAGAGVAAAAISQPQTLGTGGPLTLWVAGIPGESTVATPGLPTAQAQIDLQSFGLGGNEGSFVSPPNSGKPQFAPLVVTKAVDVASPLLYGAMAKGKALTEVVLTDAPGTDLPCGANCTKEIITLIGAKVAGITATDPAATPTETVSFTYTKISVNYVRTGTGAVTTHFGWDLPLSLYCPGALTTSTTAC